MHFSHVKLTTLLKLMHMALALKVNCIGTISKPNFHTQRLIFEFDILIMHIPETKKVTTDGTFAVPLSL